MQENNEISQYKLGLRDKIIDVAMTLFLKRGIRLVRMDDVAHEMGISKRTIYELYEKKEDLLYEVVIKHLEIRRAINDEINTRCQDVMEILLAVYHQTVADFETINPLFFSELSRYPRLNLYLAEQNKKMREGRHEFYERGVREGYFRGDVDYEMAGLLFDVMGEYIIQQQLYRQYTIEQIYRNIVFVSFRGLCTEKGIRAIDKMMD